MISLVLELIWAFVSGIANILLAILFTILEAIPLKVYLIILIIVMIGFIRKSLQ